MPRNRSKPPADAFVPTEETIDKEYQEDKYGNHRIVVHGTESDWVKFHKIPQVEVDGIHYFAVGKYYLEFPQKKVLVWHEASQFKAPQENQQVAEEVSA